MPCDLCKALQAHAREGRSLTVDCDAQIRSWVQARGFGAAHMMELDAADARKHYDYDRNHARACCRSRAPASLRAWRRYALAAWVLRRLERAWEQEQAERARGLAAFTGLPMAQLFA